MTKLLSEKKLTKDELSKLSTLLKGKRREVATLANVSVSTVNNTLQDVHQNERVIKAAYRLIKEEQAAAKPDPEITELRQLLKTVG